LNREVNIQSIFFICFCVFSYKGGKEHQIFNKTRKANPICQIFHKTFLLKHFIEGKIEIKKKGEDEEEDVSISSMTLKKIHRKLKEKALYRTE
jgi:hypothetical protein